MWSERVQNDLGATAGLRYRNGQPRTSVTERVFGGGEPHPESPGEGSAVTLTRRKSHIGRDRSPAGKNGAGGSGVQSAAFNCRSPSAFTFVSFRASFCNAASSFIRILPASKTTPSLSKRKAEEITVTRWRVSARVDYQWERGLVQDCGFTRSLQSNDTCFHSLRSFPTGSPRPPTLLYDADRL